MIIVDPPGGGVGVEVVPPLLSSDSGREDRSSSRDWNNGTPWLEGRLSSHWPLEYSRSLLIGGMMSWNSSRFSLLSLLPLLLLPSLSGSGGSWLGMGAPTSSTRAEMEQVKKLVGKLEWSHQHTGSTLYTGRDRLRSSVFLAFSWLNFGIFQRKLFE